MPRAPFELRNQAFLTGPAIASNLTIEGSVPRKDELNESDNSVPMCKVYALRKTRRMSLTGEKGSRII